jgi:hypothetical protein
MKSPQTVDAGCQEQDPKNAEKIHRSYASFVYFNIEAGLVNKK